MGLFIRFFKERNSKLLSLVLSVQRDNLPSKPQNAKHHPTSIPQPAWGRNPEGKAVFFLRTLTFRR